MFIVNFFALFYILTCLFIVLIKAKFVPITAVQNISFIFSIKRKIIKVTYVSFKIRVFLRKK